MRSSVLNKIILVSCLAFSAASASQAHAGTLVDMRFDLLIAKAAELKKDLKLNANQQVLWQQIEGKLQSIQHLREVRREHLQTSFDTQLEKDRMEVRDLNPQLEQEEQLSLQENHQMRELFFTLNDALDDTQRQAMQMYIISTLKAGPEGSKARPQDAGDTGKHKGGMGRRGGMSTGGNGENKF